MNARVFFKYPPLFYALMHRRAGTPPMGSLKRWPLYVVRRGTRAVLACRGVGNDVIPWGLA